MNLTVLGAGAWGTAVAAHAARRQPTLLWARDASQAAAMRAERCNDRYLETSSCPRRSTSPPTTTPPSPMPRPSDGLLVVATPMAALEAMLRRLPAGVPGALWLCKGLQEGSGRLGHEIARAVRPDLRVGVLSGPSFALEVGQGRPTALVAASDDEALRQAAVSALHGGALRVYTSDDVVGVEVGGALKNVSPSPPASATACSSASTRAPRSSPAASPR